MNKKDPIYIYFNLIIKNANFFIFLLLLSFVFSYLTMKNNKSHLISNITLNYSSSFMQITPLDPLYFDNFSEFRLNLKDNAYIKFVRQYVRDFQKKCSMGDSPKELFKINIPGTTIKEDYKINLSSIQINYFEAYSDKAEKCIKKAFDDFKNYENKIMLSLKKYRIKFICLAGYMKIISNFLIKNYKRKIINIHPSLLPKFKGLNTFSRMLKNREIRGGCTVHYVNEKLDSGSTIIQKNFIINNDDDEKILKSKTQKLEYKAFPEAIIKIFRNS